MLLHNKHRPDLTRHLVGRRIDIAEISGKFNAICYRFKQLEISLFSISRIEGSLGWCGLKGFG
jgi:hypothetical protein